MKKINKKVLLLCLPLLLALTISCSITETISSDSNVIYVDSDAKGLNDGTSWENAYNSLQKALSVAKADTEIWVAEGIYYPTEGKDRSISFTMVDDVDLYGGFLGNEISKDQRDWQNNKTILSGDIGVKGLKTDNSIKVIIAANNILDGFTISNGYFSQKLEGSLATNGNLPMTQEVESNKSVGHLTPDAVMSGDASSSNSGNGIIIWKVSPIIKNCIIEDNESGKGAGVYIMGNSEDGDLPTFINTTIRNNIAEGRGGGVAIDMRSKAIFIDCIFDSNECSNGKGGAIYNDFGCSPLFENCLFINNFAQSGAAIANDGVSNPVISNSTFYNNTASEAGAALYQGTGPYNDPIVTSSIIWNNHCAQDKISVYNFNECNPKITYSIVEGGYQGEGVLDVDPMFIDAEKNNFNLKDNSVAKTASSDGGQIGFRSDAIKGRTEADYKQIIKYLNSFEGSEEPTEMDLSNPVNPSDVETISYLLYVNYKAVGDNDGSSWANAYTSLQNAINVANAIYLKTDTEVDIWVAKGEYLTGSYRDDSIILQSGVNIYGGFNGDESSLKQRDYVNNQTIISGEIGDKTTKEDNSYHVFIANDNVKLDGLIITGGYADGVDGEVYDNKGGAILNYLAGNRVIPTYEPTLGFDIEINNVIFIENYAQEGGAVYTYHGGNPTFNNCSFIENSAQYGGSVLDRSGTNAIYIDCEFISNEAKYKGGSAFTDYGSMASFYNCDFSDNKSGSAGGAIYVIDRASQQVFNETDFDLIDKSWPNTTDIFSSVYLENCSFSNNRANTEGGALYVYENSFAKIVNSSFVNNEALDAAIVSSNGSTIFIDNLTSFENNNPLNTLVIGNKSVIIE